MKTVRCGSVWLLLLFCGVAVFRAPGQQAPQGAHYESHVAGRPRVIIFVHGFTGTADDSWRASNGKNFPTLLATDDRVKQANVFVASYDTRWRDENSTIDQLAAGVYKQLSDLGVFGEHKELVFVCHSLGGLVIERMLIDHLDIGGKTAFIQFYGTPHEGVLSPTTNPLLGFITLLGKNTLVPELRAGSGNEVLVQLDKDWKARQFGAIHRFCAIEIRRTYLSHVPDISGILVPYFSGSYGCDSSVPVDRIDADHVTMVRTADRDGLGNEAYLVLLRNYRENPYSEWRQAPDPTRDASHYFTVDCNHTTSDPAYQIVFPLNGSLKEELVSATAEWTNPDHIKDVNPNPPEVTRIDRATVHVKFGFNGEDKGLFGCPGGGHATLVVHPTFRGHVPVPDGG